MKKKGKKIVVRRNHIEAEKKKMGKRICYRCGAAYDMNNELIEHKIWLHGEYPKSEHSSYPNDSPIYRIYNKYFMEKILTGELESLKERNVILNGVEYKWNDSEQTYIESKQINILGSDLPDISIARDKSYLIKCCNCHRIKRFLKNPLDDENPLIICPHCGMNLLRDNRLRVCDYLIKKGSIPKEINIDVVISEIKDLNTETLKNKKTRAMGR